MVVDDGDRLSELAVFFPGATVQVPVVYGLWRRTAELAPEAAEALLDRLVASGQVAARPGGVALPEPVRETLIAGLESDRPARLHSMLLESVAVGLPRTDRVMFKPNTRAWWELDRGQRYLWDHAIAHMVAAVDGGAIAEVIACDIRWIERQLLLHGPAAVSRDLTTVGTRQAVALRDEWDLAAPLLGPTEPAESVLDVMRSRLAEAATLAWQIVEFPSTRPRLTHDGWPPDWPRRNNPPVSEINGVAVGPEGGGRLTVHADGGVSSSVDYGRGARLFQEPVGLNGVAVAADGVSMVLACDDGTLRLRRTAGPLAVAMLDDLDVRASAIAPDGAWFATAGYDGEVAVWDVLGRKRAALPGHRGPASAVAIAPDGRWLVSGGEDATVRFWTPGGRSLAVRSHAAPVRLVRIAPDGSWIASADAAGVVRLWSADGTARAGRAGHTGPVQAVAVAADSAWLATAGADGRVRLWSADGSPGAVLDGHTGSVDHVVIAPDGTWLATGGADGTVRMWNADGTPRALLDDVRGAVIGLAVAPDSGWLAAVGRPDHTAWTWNSDGTLRAMLGAHDDMPAGVAVAPDGAWLATVTHRGVRRWTPDGVPGRRYDLLGVWSRITVAPTGEWMLVAGGRLAILPCGGAPRGLVLRAHAGPVHAVAHAGRWIASAGADSTVRIWSADGSPRVIMEGHDGPVHAVAVHPVRGLVVSGGADGTVRIWRAGGRPGPVLRGHDGPVRAVAITPDGTRVIGGGADGTIRTWAADGTPGETLTGHEGAVTALAVAPDGGWFASAGHDASIRIWAGRPPYSALAMTRVSDRLNACAIRSDGSGLVTAGRAGVYAFRFDGGPART